MLRAQCDSKGRIYLRESIRSRYGRKFMVVEAADELVLLPVPEDPCKALASIGRPLRRYSLSELKAGIQKRAEEENRA